MSSSRVLQEWVVNWLVKYLNVSENLIDDDCAFSDLGVDSVGAVTLVGDIEDYLDCELEPTLLWNYPTIKELVAYLETSSKSSKLVLKASIR